jgi:hypothetical protein
LIHLFTLSRSKISDLSMLGARRTLLEIEPADETSALPAIS